jgi:hypothetical protein
MSAPTIDAARRAFNTIWPEQGDFEFQALGNTRRFAIESACEMARPIRELHRRRHLYQTLDEFLADLVPLIYAGEEMQS